MKEGLIDTYKSKHLSETNFTMPTDLRSENKDSAVRIDYIFCSGNFKIIDAKIIKKITAEKASDHYPIYSVLEI